MTLAQSMFYRKKESENETGNDPSPVNDWKKIPIKETSGSSEALYSVQLPPFCPPPTPRGSTEQTSMDLREPFVGPNPTLMADRVESSREAVERVLQAMGPTARRVPVAPGDRFSSITVPAITNIVATIANAGAYEDQARLVESIFRSNVRPDVTGMHAASGVVVNADTFYKVVVPSWSSSVNDLDWRVCKLASSVIFSMNRMPPNNKSLGPGVRQFLPVSQSAAYSYSTTFSNSVEDALAKLNNAQQVPWRWACKCWPTCGQIWAQRICHHCKGAPYRNE